MKNKNYKITFIFEDNTEFSENFSFTSDKKALDWIKDFKTDKPLKSWHLFLVTDKQTKNIKNWYNQIWFPF